MARNTVRKIDHISAGAPTKSWLSREVPRLAVIPAAAATIAFVALCHGAFAKAATPAPAPVTQTVANTSPAP